MEERDYEKEDALIEKKHKYHMEEMTYNRESQRLFHEQDLERQRIRRAESRKDEERRNNRDWLEKNKV